MVKRNKIAYWLLLFAVLLSACGLLSVGTARANYKNNVFWNTVVKSGQPVSSDCLVPGGQIILLGEVTEETEIEINFKAQSDLLGALSCELVDPEQAVYLAAFLTNDVINLHPGTQSVGLYLMPSEEALKLQSPVNVDVFVFFTAGEQTLQGTFRVTLPAAAGDESGKNQQGTSGGKDPVYDVEDDTTIIGGATGGNTDSGDTAPEVKDPFYDIEDDTTIIGGATGGDNNDSGDTVPEVKDPVYDLEDDTTIVGGVIGGDNADSGDAVPEVKDPVYAIGNDTTIMAVAGTITADLVGGRTDSIYSIENDTTIIGGAVAGDTVAGGGTPAVKDPVYDIEDDTTIIGGATNGDNSDDEDEVPETKDPVYDIEDDTTIVGGVTGGDNSTGGNNTDVENTPEVKDPVYNIENDTEIIGGDKTEPKPESVPVADEELLLESITAYSKADMLPVSVAIPEGTTRLKLSLVDPELGGETWLPAFSRYSVDGGKNWYMLYYGGTVTIEEDDLYDFRTIGQTVLLDFSGTQTYLGEVLVVQATAYADGVQYIGKTEVYSMDAFMLMSAYSMVDEMPILTLSQPLSLNERGADGIRQYTLEKLVKQENGLMRYEQVNADAISVQFENGVVALEITDELPEAGTYRLNVEYSFKGLCFAVSQHTFFVNYSGHTHAVNWG